MNYDQVDELHGLVHGIREDVDSAFYAAPEMQGVFLRNARANIERAIAISSDLLAEMERARSVS